MLKIEYSLFKTGFEFDADRILSEVNNKYWIDHNLDHMIRAGNSALLLVTSNGESNHSFTSPMKSTDALKDMPYTRSVWDKLGLPLLRSRLMRIGPGGHMPEHYDSHPYWADKIRVHIPIKTNEKVIFRCGEQIANMKAGECWIVDNMDLHEVTNPSDEERIHLVIDAPLSDWPRLRNDNV